MIEVKVKEKPVTSQSKEVAISEISFSRVPIESLLTAPLTASAKGTEALKESKELKEPLLSSIPIPTFQIDDAPLDFTMEVKESNNNDK